MLLLYLVYLRCCTVHHCMSHRLLYPSCGSTAPVSFLRPVVHEYTNEPDGVAYSSFSLSVYADALTCAELVSMPLLQH